MRFLTVFSRFYHNRDLIFQFTKREIELRHKGSRLGHFWALLTPLMMLGLYLFVFGVIFGGRFGVLKDENFFDFALALFLGISLFQVIADTISSSPSLVINQPNFVKKVVFPLEILSLSRVLASSYFASLSILITIALAPFSHGGLTLRVLELPFIILPLVLMCLGVSWALCAIGVFYRDLDHTTPFIATAVMYGSAILYSLSRVPTSIARVLQLNPLVVIINEARRVTLWNLPLEFNFLGYSYLISGLIFISGLTLFNRVRPYFAEVI
jgi:lipopolysaccharide transport system permease protein